MLETIQTKTYTLTQILDDHWKLFKKKHGDQLRPSIIESVEKVKGCRDPKIMGYHQYSCPDCGDKLIIPHTCKNRFCNSCGVIATDAWMKKAMYEFLEVPYHHLVFTIPKELRNIFAYDRSLLGGLFTAAKDSILSWCKEKQGYIPGIVMVLHTFGSDLKFNPHIHMILTEGGLSLDRQTWIKNEFIPWKMLKDRWRANLVSYLKPALKEMISENRAGPWHQQLIGERFFRVLEFSVY